MTKFSNKFKKPCFGPFSPILGQKKFSWKIWLSHAQLHMGFQHHAKIQKKLMVQFKENAWTDEGQKDGQTLFYRTLSATAGGPIKVYAQYLNDYLGRVEVFKCKKPPISCVYLLVQEHLSIFLSLPCDQGSTTDSHLLQTFSQQSNVLSILLQCFVSSLLHKIQYMSKCPYK